MASKKKQVRKTRGKTGEKTAAPKRVNKTQWIVDFDREHPDSSAAAVVAAGAAVGLTFSDKYVYNVRAKLRAPGAKRAANGKPPAARPYPVLTGGAEQTFLDAVMIIGTAKARALLDKVNAKALRVS